MTPTFRILALLITVAALPFLPPAVPLVLLVATLAALPFVSPTLRAQVVHGVWRVRWLLAAVAALYLFAGDAPWTETTGRIAVLACAVTAVQVALHGLAPAELAHALARVLTPLAPLGLPVARFSGRLVATLAAVPDVQALVAATPAPAGGTPLSRLADRAASVIAAIEAAPDSNVGAAPLRRDS